MEVLNSRATVFVAAESFRQPLFAPEQFHGSLSQVAVCSFDNHT